MKTLMRSTVVLVSSFLFTIFAVGASLPLTATAQVYPYYTNDDCYNSYYGTTYNPYYNCPTTGSLTVYVQVNNKYDGYRSPSDFTIQVSGANPSQRYFAGAQNGTTVRLNGPYNVSLYNQVGYNPTYSQDCSGTLNANENKVCYVTLTSTYTNNYYPYNYNPYSYPYQYQQPVTYVSKYVPSLPDTGFKPISASTLAFAIALLLTSIAVLYPYVRKTFAVVLN